MDIRVLYYETGSGFGGSAVSLYRLVKYLKPKSIQAFVLVHEIGGKIKELQETGVSVRVLRNYHPFPGIVKKLTGRITSGIEEVYFYGNFALNAILNALKISRVIRDDGIDLVHLNNGIFENFPGLIAAKICRVPCVAHVRGTEPLTRIEGLFGGYADKIITLNSSMFEMYRSVFGEGKSCMIFNGVDLEDFQKVEKDRIRHEFLIGEDTFLVGTFSRLVPGKGIPDFIDAAAKVLKVKKHVLFFVVGDDPLHNHSFEHEMKRLAGDLGISDKIKFTGWRNDVADLMAGVDLIVQVSTFPEGMSLTPLEGMVLGRPIITSWVPGYTDSVDHGITGFLIPPGDVGTLASTILKIITDRRLAERLGANGKEKAVREFDMKITANKVKELYDAVLSRGERT